MKFQIGDTVRIEAALLGTSLAVMLGDKAQGLVGRQGVVVERFPLSERPWLVGLSVGGAPVHIRLRGKELRLVASVTQGLPFDNPTTRLCFA